MVEGKGALEPVSGDVPGVPVPTDVVDQYIDPGKAPEYLVSQSAHLRLAGQVRDEHVHRPAAGCARPLTAETGTVLDPSRGPAASHPCPAVTSHTERQAQTVRAPARSRADQTRAH